MNQFVVDSSIAAKWFLTEEYTDVSLKLLDPDFELHVPSIFFLEIDNILCKKIRRNELSNQESQKVRNGIREMPFYVHSFEDVLEPAYEIAIRTGASIYDCIFLAVALIGDFMVVTADRRFFENILKSQYSKHIIWIEDLEK